MRDAKDARPEPVAQAQRLESVDVLRGFALLGILVMNIQSFSMVGAAYANPTVLGPLAGVEYWVWYAGRLFFDLKFMALFSMLFGAGVVLMSENRATNSNRPWGFHYRRMAVLLVFGLMHAHLLWYGDILVAYALCGTLVYLLRKRPPRQLLVLALPAIAVPSLLFVFFGLTMPYWGDVAVQEMREMWSPTAEAIRTETEVYQGPWTGQMTHRAPTALLFETFIFAIYLLWRCSGLMLLGMALYKWGIISASRSPRFYKTMAATGMAIGLSIIVYGTCRNEANGWTVEYSKFLGSNYNYWGSLFVAIGWIGVVMLACKSSWTARLRRPLAAVGQMALTNYLMHTVICTTIFYGHGFGLFGQIDRAGQLAVVAGVWAFQLVASPLWLGTFRFGPAEWLWRTLTYMQLQPILRRHAS